MKAETMKKLGYFMGQAFFTVICLCAMAAVIGLTVAFLLKIF